MAVQGHRISLSKFCQSKWLRFANIWRNGRLQSRPRSNGQREATRSTVVTPLVTVSSLRLVNSGLSAESRVSSFHNSVGSRLQMHVPLCRYVARLFWCLTLFTLLIRLYAFNRSGYLRGFMAGGCCARISFILSRILGFFEARFVFSRGSVW